MSHPESDQNIPHKRRNFLKELCETLIGPYIRRRMQNPFAIQKGVKDALAALGFQIPVRVNDTICHESSYPKTLDVVP